MAASLSALASNALTPNSVTPSSAAQPGGNALDPQLLAQIKEQMADIIEPSAIGIWPLAWGWWAVIALTITGIAIATFLLLQHRKRNRYRRQALAVIAAQQFDSALTQGQFLMHLSKQVALVAYPKERQLIASASGERWLRWLNGKTPKPLFNTECAKQWQAALYAPSSQQTPEHTLTQALTEWIKTHKQQSVAEVSHV